MKNNNIDIKDILDEYRPNNDIFSTESEDMLRLKNIIFNDLDEAERRIICIYAEIPSLRKVANILGVSPSLVNLIIKKIRVKIYEHLSRRI